jgi:hypothetical protein
MITFLPSGARNNRPDTAHQRCIGPDANFCRLRPTAWRPANRAETRSMRCGGLASAGCMMARVRGSSGIKNALKHGDFTTEGLALKRQRSAPSLGWPARRWGRSSSGNGSVRRQWKAPSRHWTISSGLCATRTRMPAHGWTLPEPLPLLSRSP